MGIGVLGPLVVHDDAPLRSRRDRVVLAALAIHAREVVSAERLADALWSERPPDSWSKVVQGCIVRLRKRLGPGAIATAPPGYRLDLSDDEIDARRFEALVRRARELTALGQFERASHAATEALDLWRGDALPELEGWEPGEIVARRLGVLRLEAEELAVESAIRAGRSRDVVADAQALVGRAPLREVRWAQLATALYQSGQQGAALRTLHAARRTLATELGLEPGPELVALERAILRQEPMLEVPASSSGGAECPYPGLLAYGVDDADSFHGRDAEVGTCLGRLSETGVLAIVGPSGCGKSSLARAGVAAALRRSGREIVVLQPGPNPVAALQDATTSAPGAVVIVDQCEELVMLCDDPHERRRFAERLVAGVHPQPVVVVIRADRLADLSTLPPLARLVERGLYLLGAMDEAALRAAIEGPARQAGLHLEPGLTDLLVHECEGHVGALPLLSHVLRQTWERREGRTLTIDGYRASGGIRGAIAQTADGVYQALSPDAQGIVRELLLRLVVPTAENEPSRARVPLRVLASDPDRVRLTELLVGARLLTTSDDGVELAHEALARAWPRLRAWFDEDVAGRRTMSHLAESADVWETMGRPESELYRGARLAQAGEWIDRADPDLSPTERAFVEASAALAADERHAAEVRARHQARQNRQLRVLLAAVAATLVCALLAGSLAVVESRRVAEQRDAAELASRRAQLDALTGRPAELRAAHPDVAALLAIEAERLDPGPVSRAALLETLTDDPGFVATIHVADADDGLTSAVVLPDETTAFVAGWDGIVRVVDLVHGVDTGQRLADPEFGELSESRLALSDDGTLLAEVSGGSRSLEAGTGRLVLYDVATGDLRLPPIELEAGVGDVDVSPDGRWVAVAGGSPAAAYVYDAVTGALVRALPGLPRPAGSVLRANTAAIAFDDDGHLFVSSEAGPVRRFEVPGFVESERLGGAPSPGATTFDLVVAPDGRTLVGTSEFGDTAAWDLPSGALRWTRSGQTCYSVAFDIDPNGPLHCGLTEGGLIELDPTSGDQVGERVETGGGFVQDLVALPATAELLVVSEFGPLVVRALDGHGPAHRLIAAPASVPGPYSPDGRLLVVWTPGDDRFRQVVRDPETGDVVDELDGIVQVGWASERRLAGYLVPGELGVYDLGEGHRTTRIRPAAFGSQLPRGGAIDVADGRLLVFLPDGHHRVFDLATGRMVGPELPLDRLTDGAAFSADGSLLALRNGVAGVSVFEARTVEHLAGPVAAGSTAMTFDPNGRLIVALPSGELSVRDGRSLEPLATLTVGSAAAVGLTVSADGTTMLVSSAREAVLVDLPSGTPIGRWPLQWSGVSRGVVRYAALRPDGAELALPTADGIAVWDLDPAHWEAAACRLAGRNLTREEWDDLIGDLAPYRALCPAVP
jgi:DNA-binding SARP family transcriptional activator/WD40 repeat protein/energy-coupling factor transporter ATP-binding protein EcfA2